MPTTTTADALLDRLDNIECHLAETSVALANAAAAFHDLEESIPLTMESTTHPHTTTLCSDLASMVHLCAKAEETCTELQAAIRLAALED